MHCSKELHTFHGTLANHSFKSDCRFGCYIDTVLLLLGGVR